MRNLVLFVLGFIVVACAMLMVEAGKMRTESHQPDYQAYTRPRINMEDMK